jgi:predicted peptidase
MSILRFAGILSFIQIAMAAFSQSNYTIQSMDTIRYTGIKVDYRYLVRMPENQKEGELLPLIVFLHGSGERGDDPELLKVHGPWKFADSRPDFPFMIVAPQCKRDLTWEAVSLDLFLDEIMLRYPIDSTRIYLTGLSRGGFGVWDWVLYHPERFAAIAPICGASNYHLLCVNILAGTPAWIFHGGKDNIIPVEFSEKLAKSLDDFGAEVRTTIYPEAGHDSWTETYLNPELYDWFLRHRR